MRLLPIGFIFLKSPIMTAPGALVHPRDGSNCPSRPALAAAFAPQKNTARSFHRAVSIAQSWAGWDGLLLRLFVGVDHVARLVFGRRYDGQGVRVLELVDAVALDAAELRLEHPRLRPFAIGGEFDVADDGLERGLADVVGELAVVEALGGGY